MRYTHQHAQNLAERLVTRFPQTPNADVPNYDRLQTLVLHVLGVRPAKGLKVHVETRNGLEWGVVTSVVDRPRDGWLANVEIPSVSGDRTVMFTNVENVPWSPAP